jgi:putative intracellular protease/amidase
MLTGTVGALLGAAKPAKQAYTSLSTASAFQNPRSWTDESFTLDEFDLVFVPGGHDRAIRQILDSQRVHELLAGYFLLTKKPSKKSIAAICHGGQLLAASSYKDGKSILADVTTTALQRSHEQGIYQATRLFLGDYYKSMGVVALGYVYTPCTHILTYIF